MIDVVLSRFNEDISWTHDLGRDCRLFTYNKGSGPPPWLPNVGREAQTYLHHIVRIYGQFSEWTFFSQADPAPHLRAPLHEIIRTFPQSADRGAFYIEGGPIFFSSAAVRYSGPAEKQNEEKGVPEVWRELFTSDQPADLLFAPGAIFAISAERLMTRSTAFYTRAMELASTRPRGPWEFERLWAYLWTSSAATRL